MSVETGIVGKRGKRRARTEHNSPVERATAVLQALDPTAPMSRLADSPAHQLLALESLAVTPERVQQLTAKVLNMTELSMNHVLHNLRETALGDAPPKGTKDWTTIGAILVDKFSILQNLVMHLDGRTSGASIQELNRKAAELVSVTQELERRSAAVDVTPKPKS